MGIKIQSVSENPFRRSARSRESKRKAGITMELRTAASPRDVKHYTTQRLREEFLIQNVFVPDEIRLVYSHIDRIITGSATPAEKELKLVACLLYTSPSPRDS